jgi:DNA polymerase
MRLWLDYETRGHIDIKVGAHPYAMRADPLILAYGVDDGPVTAWRVEYEPPPEALRQALTLADEVWAHHAEFDFAVHEVHAPRYRLPVPPIRKMRCSMTAARAAGLVGELEGACRALGLPGKLAGGGTLMTLFCIKGARPEDHPEEWQQFIRYAIRDVAAMRALVKQLPPLPEREWRVWQSHALINRRGVRVDTDVARGTQALHEEFAVRAADRCRKITGFKATQRDKLRGWLIRHGVFVPDMKEATLAELERDDLDHAQRTVLDAWSMASKKGATKAGNMLAYIHSDDQRIRDCFAIFGAANGRWSSKGRVQLHNLPRPRIEGATITWLIDLLASVPTVQLADLFETWSDDPAAMLSSCVRGLLIPREGSLLHAADFSRIEYVILLHAAGETEAIERVRCGQDPYKWLYATWIARPAIHPDEVAKNSAGRLAGKQATLGCGYGLGAVKFARINKMSLALGRAAVNGYRKAYPRVVKLWYELNDAAIATARDGNPRAVSQWPGVYFAREGRWLALALPSGRKIYFFNPHLVPQDNGFDGLQLISDGPPTTYSRKADQQPNGLYPRRFYGGALCEYLICGAARDMLADSLVRLDDAGFETVMHVHDEAVIEGPPSALGDFTAEMLRHPEWARGWDVAVESGSLQRYRKLD